MAFQVPLTEQKVKPHQVTALHLVAGFALLALAAIGLLVNNTVMTLPGAGTIEEQKVTIEKFDTLDIGLSITMGLSIVILFAALFRNKWLRKPSINKVFRIGELLILAAAAVYLLTLNLTVPAVVFGILAATMIFSLTWETGKDTRLYVQVRDQGISLPVTSRRRSVAWLEVEKVLLRHGTITINCVDNRMYQWVTAANDINVEEFEAYCDALIQAAMKDRKKDW